jgi:hypothetical protein
VDATQGLAFASLGLPWFLLASGRRRQKPKKEKKQENRPLEKKGRFMSP